MRCWWELSSMPAVRSVRPRSSTRNLPETRAGSGRQDEGFARVRFRSRKNPRQTFTVQANCVSDMGIYRSKLGDMQMAEKLPVPENRNICRLSLKYGQYHMAVPYDEKLPPQRENQARVVALDPGVRSFLTWYCAESVGKIGEGAFFRIQRLCERTGRPAEPRSEVSLKKAQEHAPCCRQDAAQDREPGAGAAQAGSEVPCE